MERYSGGTLLVSKVVNSEYGSLFKYYTETSRKLIFLCPICKKEQQLVFGVNFVGSPGKKEFEEAALGHIATHTLDSQIIFLIGRVLFE